MRAGDQTVLRGALGRSGGLNAFGLLDAGWPGVIRYDQADAGIIQPCLLNDLTCNGIGFQGAWKIVPRGLGVYPFMGIQEFPGYSSQRTDIDQHVAYDDRGI